MTTVPPFEGQTQESELLAFCGRSPLLDIRYVLADIFFLFFEGEVYCVPWYNMFAKNILKNQ